MPYVHEASPVSYLSFSPLTFPGSPRCLPCWLLSVCPSVICVICIASVAMITVMPCCCSRSAIHIMKLARASKKEEKKISEQAFADALSYFRQSAEIFERLQAKLEHAEAMHGQ